MKNRPLVKKTLLESLKSGASIVASCEGARISRETFYAWIHQDEQFGQDVQTAKDSRTEFVEDALYQNALKGNATAQIFFLCNRAPERWKNVHKVEAELNGDVPIAFVPYDPAKHKPRQTN